MTRLRSRSSPGAVLALLLLTPVACGGDESEQTTPVRTADCGLVSFTPQSDDGAFDVRARGVDCITAREVAASSRTVRLDGRTARYEAEDFRCTGQLKDNEMDLAGVVYRCTREGAVITFTRN